MPQIHRSALLPYQPEQLFALVNDVAAYPEFVPWCIGAEVLATSPEAVDAALTLGRGPVKERFVTRNHLHFPDRIDLSLLEGPFSHLHGTWRFQRLGNEGCKVELDMDFKLSNKVWGRMFGALFTRVVEALVDSFCQRARDLYGSDTGAQPQGSDGGPR